jgi:hypothetical protein
MLPLPEDGSPAFEEFLAFLGQKIVTLGWKGYAGGIDVKGSIRVPM